MKENYSEKKITKKTENFSPIYSSNGFLIERYTRDNVNSKIPESSELERSHPDLYKFLSLKTDTKNFNIGFIHIDMDGAVSKKLVSDGKNMVQIGFYLVKLLKDNLSQIAKKLKDDNFSEIGKIDFLVNISRLGSAENYLEKMGFEVFNINDTEEAARFGSKSHKLVAETSDEFFEKNNIEVNLKIVKDKKEKPAKIVLISKEVILEKYLM